jgi:proteasome accessory factor C
MFLAWALANQAAVLEPAHLAAELADRRSALAARLDQDAPTVALPEPSGVADGGDARPGRRTPTAAGRVERLLALVPWVLAHRDAGVAEVCAHFGIDRQTLLADLDLLFVSGLPPYGPGDLIEAWVDGDRIHIDLADYFAKAPRLTWRETVGLYLAARALATVPGFDQHDALTRARKRLEASLPSDQLRRLLDVAARVEVDLEGDPVERQHLPVLTQAADSRIRVELEYYSSSRTEHTRRRVDPWALFPASGHWYLAGWCHLAGDERLFRVDRMLSVTPTGERFEPPAGLDPAAHRRLPQSFTPTGVRCAIAVDEDAEWVATVLPVQGTARMPDGRLLVRLAAQELSWAARLVVRLAPAAVPLDPPELREAVVRLLPAS